MKDELLLSMGFLVSVFDLFQLLLILQWHFCRNFCNESQKKDLPLCSFVGIIPRIVLLPRNLCKPS